MSYNKPIDVLIEPIASLSLFNCTLPNVNDVKIIKITNNLPAVVIGAKSPYPTKSQCTNLYRL